MSNRVFSECDKCGTPIYIITKTTGDKINVNAQKINMKAAQILYDINIKSIIDNDGSEFTDFDRLGFLEHKYTCRNKK